MDGVASTSIYYRVYYLIDSLILLKTELIAHKEAPVFYICENKDADQLCADQRLCFFYIDSTIDSTS